MTAWLVLWSTTAWRTEATGWLDARLADLGAERTGPVTQPHVRPWATALRAETTLGRVWLKACAPGTAFEPRLYELLTRLIPDDVLAPLALDTARGWLLLPDGGVPIRLRLSGAELAAVTRAAIRRYAQVQRVLAPYLAELFACEVTDLRPGGLLDHFDEQLAWVGHRVDLRVPALRPRIERWCAELADAPGDPSLDHNDLHGWNILGEIGSIRFYDWGDSVISHPFASVLVPLEFAEPADRPALLEAFLDGYADVAPRADLRRAALLACRLSAIARTLAYQRALGSHQDEHWHPSAEYLNGLTTEPPGFSP